MARKRPPKAKLSKRQEASINKFEKHHGVAKATYLKRMMMLGHGARVAKKKAKGINL
ncbi:MAG: hypothetical protein Tp172DCM1112201_30 [Prokaryotic dsDNA virus sp.]|mgnify:FL=1|nr:MAG: hypothetical protein Tp172DCM1112201_30 [Prokaryotic dsDNA virus sp.]|tara:strand:+ start:1096 stop:1266 length:171 start_codon:yes stop_codon:yes gene_type:complete